MPFDGTNLSQLKLDLIAARQLLLDKGWVPHWGTGTVQGPNCLLTANAAIAKHEDYAIEAARRIKMLNAIVKATSIPPTGLVNFNDSRTSIDEVLAVYDRAIAEVE